MSSSLPNNDKEQTTGQSSMAPSSQPQTQPQPQPQPQQQPETAPQTTNPPATSNADQDSSNNKGEAGAPGANPPQQGQYVVGVPPQQIMVPAWSTGLFECFDDLPTLIITFFAPCVTFGQIAEMVDRGRANWSMYALFHFLIMYFTGCGCMLSAYYRIKMTHLYRLPDDPLINILVHLICEPCALCQEYRELQAHGFNMQLGLGWEKQSPEIQQTGGIMVPPQVPRGMNRQN